MRKPNPLSQSQAGLNTHTRNVDQRQGNGLWMRANGRMLERLKPCVIAFEGLDFDEEVEF
jgi:hypothetical protein